MKRTLRRTKSRTVGDVREEIRTFLKRNPLLSYKKRQLAKLLGYTSEHEYARFKQALRQLEQEGEVHPTGRRKLGTPQQPEALTGRLGINKGGSIFFTPDSPTFGGDAKVRFIVSRSGIGDANPGDRVRVEAVGGSGKTIIVRVIEVLEHEKKEIVGIIERTGSSYKLLTRNKSLPTAVDISRMKLGGAREGEKVLARLIVDSYGGYSAEVESVFGRAGDPNVELESIAVEFDLRMDFPHDVLSEAESIPDDISDRDIAGRLNLRNETVFTIDPENAKDFDDAVSLKKISDEVYELGVHIADVSHYVRPGGALDAEAYKRGTSVYLTSGVIPMLPHKLSNEICSLNPNVDRLAYSVIMKVHPTGKVIDYRFGKSVIRSKRRFTYEEVQKIIETGKGDFAEVILEMNGLAKKLTKLRNRSGSIDFDLPEAEFVYDELGRPIEIIKKQRLSSHRLVEEFMLLANRTVAAHIGRHGVRAKPFIYRIHDVPDPDRIRELAVFVSHFGYKLNYDGSVSQEQLQKLLQSVEGKPEEYLINDIVLRSMAKAVYSEKNIGHYGLAFKYYTHFTSPIRRYPDLMVHRLLHMYESGEEVPDARKLIENLAAISKASSEAERRAVEAERESVKVKQAQYMIDHIDDEFEGTISGVTNFGMFVEVDDLLIEGLVHVREISRQNLLIGRDGARRSDDYYTFVPGEMSLKGKRSGKKFQLGDRVRVRVLRVNMERHEIDFTLC